MTFAQDKYCGLVADVPPLSFGYIYNLWNGDQHGTFPPILFTTNFARAFDAYTGEPMFNVTNVPTGTTVAGPTGEQIRYVISNAGTNANPQWYLAEWNSSKLWQYDVNPYTGGGSFNPSVINASNGVIILNIPINPNVPSPGLGSKRSFQSQYLTAQQYQSTQTYRLTSPLSVDNAAESVLLVKE